MCVASPQRIWEGGERELKWRDRKRGGSVRESLRRKRDSNNRERESCMAEIRKADKKNRKWHKEKKIEKKIDMSAV